MSVESLWYSSYRDGEPPRCRRLLRVPRRHQFEAAIHLARGIANLTEDGAGWRQVYMTGGATVEEWWYAPVLDREMPDRRKARAAATGWWLVPRRIGQRARDLYHAAVHCACMDPHMCRRGAAQPEDIEVVLARWARSGHWRQVVARRSPWRNIGTTPRVPRRRSRKRRGKRPGRHPRPLPVPMP